MAKLLSLYTLAESVYNKYGDQIAYYEENLPHGDILANAFIKDWNESADKFMLGLINKEVGKDRIKSIYARRYKKNSPEVTVAVEVVAKEGKQFRGSMKEDIFEYLSSQYCDGWGEGFFGPINMMSADDGTRFCAE